MLILKINFFNSIIRFLVANKKKNSKVWKFECRKLILIINLSEKYFNCLLFIKTLIGMRTNEHVIITLKVIFDKIIPINFEVWKSYWKIRVRDFFLWTGTKNDCFMSHTGLYIFPNQKNPLLTNWTLVYFSIKIIYFTQIGLEYFYSEQNNILKKKFLIESLDLEKQIIKLLDYFLESI